jgi:hypothetical protein
VQNDVSELYASTSGSCIDAMSGGKGLCGQPNRALLSAVRGVLVRKNTISYITLICTDMLLLYIYIWSMLTSKLA